MNTLFIIDGASGTGKSDLVEFVKSKRERVCNIVSKYTTRLKRKDDCNKNKFLDINFIKEDEFTKKIEDVGKDNFYTYLYDNKRYGFHKKDLDESIRSYENTFVIVRSRDIISKLIEDYTELVDVVPVLIHSDREFVIQRLKAEKYTDEEIQFRLGRDDLVQSEYNENGDIYQNVILNNSRKEDFHKKIHELIDLYSVQKESGDIIRISPSPKENFTLIPELVAYKKKILTKLQKYPYEKNVFLMMKFRENNRDSSDYIREELAIHGYNCVCVRNDINDHEQNAEWNITNTVFNPIAAIYCCKYGVALFDEPEEGNKYSPNVAYELGIMHYQQKECLILKHSSLGEYKPFDLIKDLHQEYKEKADFRQIFKRWMVKICSD